MSYQEHSGIICKALNDYRQWFENEEDGDDSDLLSEIDAAIKFIKQPECLIKDKIVITIEGGNIQSVHSERPAEYLVIDEALDTEEGELLEMFKGEALVYAFIRKAECDPVIVADTFEKYKIAIEEKGETDV